MLDDSEIAHALNLGSKNILRSAAWACTFLAAKLTREQTTTIQGLSISRDTSAEGYKKLASEYRRMAMTRKSLFIVKDVADKNAFIEDLSLIPPEIRKGIHDNILAFSTPPIFGRDFR